MSVILHRRGSAVEWSTANPVLGESEIGYITSGTGAGSFKIGNGTSNWNTLKLFGGVPVGAIAMWYTNTAPDGWIFCHGQATTAYADLAAVIGATVPNMQTRVPVGRNSAGTGTFGTLGATGGAETVTLTAAQSGIRAHNHSITDVTHNHSQNSHGHTQSAHNHYSPGGHTYQAHDGYVSGRPLVPASSSGYAPNVLATDTQTPAIQNTTATNNASYSGITSTNDAASSDATQSHTNLQPYIVLNYIIKI